MLRRPLPGDDASIFHTSIRLATIGLTFLCRPPISPAP
jgi:hypothetical protein